MVEDHFINREMITRILEHLGCRVESAADGMQAYVASSRHRFDLILMDCQMPRMDGFQAVRAIREHERLQGLPRVPIVALSANMAGQDRARCLSAGMDDFIAKPAALKELREVLERFLTSPPLLDAEAPQPAAAAAPASDSALDPRALDAVRKLHRKGGPNLVVTLLADFLEQSPLRLAELIDMLLRGQARNASDIAHGMKGVCATLGANELAERLGVIEREQRKSLPMPGQDDLLALTRLHRRCCAELDDILQAERAREVGPA